VLFEYFFDTFTKIALSYWRYRGNIILRRYKNEKAIKQNIKNILVIKLYGIGNMVLFTPTLQEIRRIFPRSKITLITQEHCVEVVKGCHYYDEVIFYPPVTTFDSTHQDFFKGVRRLRKKKFDLILSSFIMGDKRLPPLLSLLGAKYIVGYSIDGGEGCYTHILEYKSDKHEVELNLDLLRVLGINTNLPELYLQITLKERENTSKYLRENNLENKFLVGFHPGSDEPLKAKRWPKEKFAELGDLIQKTYGATILIFGDESENSYAIELGALMEKPPFCLTGKTSVREAAALIERCHLFVSNDSGLMHIASAVKTPVIGLFGPTILDKNYPWGDRKINRTIFKGIKCSPCYSFKGIDCSDIKCLKKISVSEVMGEIDDLIKKGDVKCVVESKFLTIENRYDG